MANIKLLAAQTSAVVRGSENQFVSVRGTRDGSLFTAAWAIAMGLEGRIMGCHFGTLTTPLATAATTAIVTLRPQAHVRIPDGTAIIPLSVNIIVEANGATTQGEIAIASTTVDPGDGTGAAGTQQPVSLSTNRAISSNCTTRQLMTGDITAETGLLELKRFSFAASAVNQDFNYKPMADLVIPLLRGPAGLLVYLGGNAVSFYCSMQWIEIGEVAGAA